VQTDGQTEADKTQQVDANVTVASASGTEAETPHKITRK